MSEGAALELRELPTPEPGPGEVLVRVCAAGGSKDKTDPGRAPGADV